MANRRAGFTLLEVGVALAIALTLLVTARAMISAIGRANDQLTAVAQCADEDANAERLMRSLVGAIEVDTAQATYFGGDQTEMDFTSWCEMPSGWLERCRVRLQFDSTATD